MLLAYWRTFLEWKLFFLHDILTFSSSFFLFLFLSSFLLSKFCFISLIFFRRKIMNIEMNKTRKKVLYFLFFEYLFTFYIISLFPSFSFFFCSDLLFLFSLHSQTFQIGELPQKKMYNSSIWQKIEQNHMYDNRFFFFSLLFLSSFSLFFFSLLFLSFSLILLIDFMILRWKK